MKENMISKLVQSAKKRVRSGYYVAGSNNYEKKSLVKSLSGNGTKVIAEVKKFSPYDGEIAREFSIEEKLSEYVSGGADALSVLTEPDNFLGNLDYLGIAKKLTGLPVLMKDFVISKEQIYSASTNGADAVLLIKKVFDAGLSEISIENAIKLAHENNLEVLVESHNEEELINSLGTEADIIGINSRNLETGEVSLEKVIRLLALVRNEKRPVVIESGVRSVDDARYLISRGAKNLLIGTLLMKSNALNIIRQIKYRGVEV